MAINYVEPAESEKEYRELSELGRELGLPVSEAFLEIEVRMPEGPVLEERKQRSHSWNRNAYNTLFSQMACTNLDYGGAGFGAGKLSMKNTSGVVKQGGLAPGMAVSWWDGNAGATTMEVAGYGYMGGLAAYDKGIIIGTGAGAENFDDHILGTVIVNGTGAGQMSYVYQQAPSLGYDVPTKTLSVAYLRYFNNNSGGPINLTETGLYLNTMCFTNSNIFCMSRDVFAAVPVPDTAQLKVTYTFSMVFPV